MFLHKSNDENELQWNIFLTIWFIIIKSNEFEIPNVFPVNYLFFGNSKSQKVYLLLKQLQCFKMNNALVHLKNRWFEEELHQNEKNTNKALGKKKNAEDDRKVQAIKKGTLESDKKV